MAHDVGNGYRSRMRRQKERHGVLPNQTTQKPLPFIIQNVDIICNEGGTDKEKDTIMHYGGKGCKQKALIFSNLNIYWRKRVATTNTWVTVGDDFNVR